MMWEMASFIGVRLEITSLAGFDEGREKKYGGCGRCAEGIK